MDWTKYINDQYCNAVSSGLKINAVLMSRETKKEFIDSLPALVHGMAKTQGYNLGDTLMGYPVKYAEIEGIRFIHLPEEVK